MCRRDELEVVKLFFVEILQMENFSLEVTFNVLKSQLDTDIKFVCCPVNTLDLSARNM